jgi:hypothetical protein
MVTTRRIRWIAALYILATTPAGWGSLDFSSIWGEP